jgi:predicted dehydrogenase
LQEIYPPEGFERNWMFLDELRHFRDLVNGKADPLCSLEDGIQALRLSLSALSFSQQVKK